MQDHYFEKLYLLQDEVLAVLTPLDVAFYLTGGTASSRGYLQHRFSDDLDFFVNDDPRFGLWSDRVIQSLAQKTSWKLEVLQRDTRFVRANVERAGVSLKIDLVNDVPAHVGTITMHPTLGRLDSPENIVANKVTALLDRAEPKDLADIWGFCCRRGVPVRTAIEDANSKAVGIFAVDLGRALLGAMRSDWEAVRWIEAPDADLYVAELHALGESLIVP